MERPGEELAILGGPPAVDIPPPHFRWPIIGPDEEAAVLRQLRTGPLSFPRRAGVVQELEEAFASLHGVPYAMSAHSGTGALHAAFFGVAGDPGDEVLAPAYTHLASVLPMLHANLVPILCDVDPETGNIDPSEIEARVSSRTRAVVVTHQYGHVCEMDAIMEVASRRALLVIEDASHAIGSTYRGRLAGTFGDVACFSLQAHKPLTAGEGGILIARNADVFGRAALLGHFRERTAATSEEMAPFVETGYGLKFRLHPLGAALALAQLRRLPEILAGRRENLEYFRERLQDVPGVRPLPTKPYCDRGGYFRFLVSYDADRMAGLPIDRYIEALRAEGVAEVLPGHHAKPLHLTRLFQTGWDRMVRSPWLRGRPTYGPGDFPRAETFSNTTLQFPAFTEPSKRIIDQYSEAIRKVATNADRLVARSAGLATTHG